MISGTILVIRCDDKFSAMLRDAGFEVVNLELIRTEPVADLSGLRERLERLSGYDNLFFTSPAAAEVFVKERNRRNGFHGTIYALGSRAQRILSDAGVNVVQSDANTAEEMLGEIGAARLTNKRSLFIRGEKSQDTIADRLRPIAEVDEIVVYRTVPVDVSVDDVEAIRARSRRGRFSFVCFFSPSGAERFVALFPDVVKTVTAAAIGTTTGDAARTAGFEVGFISSRSSAHEFARGLIEHIKNIE